jgi:putative addiction module component (TIGR02574 family)
MNKRLSDAISRLNELPEDRQEAVAELLLDYLDHEEVNIELTAEHIAELDRRLNDDDFASEDEVKAFFASLKA